MITERVTKTKSRNILHTQRYVNHSKQHTYIAHCSTKTALVKVFTGMLQAWIIIIVITCTLEVLARPMTVVITASPWLAEKTTTTWHMVMWLHKFLPSWSQVNRHKRRCITHDYWVLYSILYEPSLDDRNSTLSIYIYEQIMLLQ